MTVSDWKRSSREGLHSHTQCTVSDTIRPGVSRRDRERTSPVTVLGGSGGVE